MLLALATALLMFLALIKEMFITYRTALLLDSFVVTFTAIIFANAYLNRESTLIMATASGILIVAVIMWLITLIKLIKAQKYC